MMDRKQVLEAMRKATENNDIPGLTDIKPIWVTTMIDHTTWPMPEFEEKNHILTGLIILYLEIIWTCSLTVSMTLIFERWGTG